MARSKPVVQIDGAREIRRQLKAAGDDLNDLKALHKKAAAIAAGGADKRVPHGPTGRLAGTVRASGTKTAGIIRAGRKSVPYAGPIHWGWAARGIKAQPFLSQGAQATEPQWIPIYEHGLDDILATIKGDR